MAATRLPGATVFNHYANLNSQRILPLLLVLQRLGWEDWACPNPPPGHQTQQLALCMFDGQLTSTSIVIPSLLLKTLPPHFLPSLHSSTPSHVSLIHQFPMIKCPWVPPSDRKSLGSNTWRCDVTEATAVSHLKMLRGTCDYKPLEGSNSRGKDLSGRWTGRRKWKQIQFLLQTTFLRTYHIRHCQMLSDLLCHT